MKIRMPVLCLLVSAAALLVGPILYRTAMQSGSVDDDLIDRLIDTVGTWRT